MVSKAKGQGDDETFLPLVNTASVLFFFFFEIESFTKCRRCYFIHAMRESALLLSEPIEDGDKSIVLLQLTQYTNS